MAPPEKTFDMPLTITVTRDVMNDNGPNHFTICVINQINSPIKTLFGFVLDLKKYRSDKHYF